MIIEELTYRHVPTRADSKDGLAQVQCQGTSCNLNLRRWGEDTLWRQIGPQIPVVSRLLGVLGRAREEDSVLIVVLQDVACTC